MGVPVRKANLAIPFLSFMATNSLSPQHDRRKQNGLVEGKIYPKTWILPIQYTGFPVVFSGNIHPKIECTLVVTCINMILTY
jgi:hypothetical protein